MDLFSGSFSSVKKDAEKGEKPEDKIKIWVLRCSRTGRVHYLEAYKDFVDVLLGFLMLRTGALIRLHRALSPAMKQAKSDGMFGVYESFKSFDDSLAIVDKDILLDPFQRVKVSEELDSLDSGDFECCNADCCRYLAGSRQICRSCTVSTHFSCITCGGYFRENAHTSLCYTPWRPWRNHMTAAPILTRYTVIQSCSPTRTTNKPKKEGYVRTNIPFIITNDLNITPLSTFNVSEVLKSCGAGNCEDLECYELSVGTSEVLVMLGAALTSTTPLTDIFGKMCSKQTRVPSSASFCLLPSFRKNSDEKSNSRNHDGSSTKRKAPSVKQCKKNQKDLPDEEQTAPSKPTKEQISKRTSSQQQPAADMAPEPRVSCLGIRSSFRKKSPEQTRKRLSFSCLPASSEAPEAQPPSSIVSSSPRRACGLGSGPEAPTQLSSSSFQQQAASYNVPEPPVPIASESSFNGGPNSEDLQQSILMERCFWKPELSMAELQSMTQTASKSQMPWPQPEQGLQPALPTITASSNYTLSHHSTQFSSPQNLPSPPVPPQSQSILNPLFRESSPPGVSSRPSQLPTSSNPSIVHRSYPQGEPRPRISGRRPAVQFGQNFAATGLGSLPSVAAAFGKSASDDPTWSDVESTFSDGSGCSTLDRLN